MSQLDMASCLHSWSSVSISQKISHKEIDTLLFSFYYYTYTNTELVISENFMKFDLSLELFVILYIFPISYRMDLVSLNMSFLAFRSQASSLITWLLVCHSSRSYFTLVLLSGHILPQNISTPRHFSSHIHSYLVFGTSTCKYQYRYSNIDRNSKFEI